MDHSTVLLHALLEAAANPDVSREALEEIAALGDDPERLESLVGPQEDDPEDVPIGKRYRGAITKSHRPEEEADTVDYSALAHWHAKLFSMLEASGLEVTDEDIAEAESELDGTGWSVGRDDDGEWQARSTTSMVRKSWRWGVLEKAAQRAPAGYSRANPFHFNGRDYVGGQFIPGKAIETASEEDRAKLEQAKESEDRAAETKKQARGSVAVDPAALLESLKEHGGVELSKGDRGNAARAYAALKRHHGDLTLHRVAELAQRAQKALANIEDDNPNAEGLRTYWSKQLAVMSGWVERAQSEGMTGEARAAKIEEPVVTPEPVEKQPSSTTPAAPDWSAMSAEEVDAAMAGLVGLEYGQKLRGMPRDVADAFLDRSSRARTADRRSRAATRGAQTRQKNKEQEAELRSTPEGERYAKAQEAMEWLGKRARAGIHVDDWKFREAEEEIQNASLAYWLTQRAKNPDEQDKRKDAAAPAFTLESGPDPVKAVREINSIPWVVEGPSGRKVVITGAELRDFGKRRMLYLYGTSPGTMPNDPHPIQGVGGALLIDFEHGSHEMSRRARRLVYHIAHGKAQNLTLNELENLLFSGTLTDSQGRTYQFEDGKRVASPETQTQEPSTTNPVDTASVTQHNAPVSSGAQERQAMTHTVYQGTGRASQGSIYSMGQGAVMDDADYYAFDEGSARGYGPEVKQTQVSLSSPARITSDIDWADLAKAAGVPQDLALMSAYGGDTSQVQAAKAKLRAYLVSQGHDGMVVQIDRSKPTKKVNRLFGHDQLVKFRDTKEQAVRGKEYWDMTRDEFRDHVQADRTRSAKRDREIAERALAQAEADLKRETVNRTEDQARAAVEAAKGQVARAKEPAPLTDAELDREYRSAVEAARSMGDPVPEDAYERFGVSRTAPAPEKPKPAPVAAPAAVKPATSAGPRSVKVASAGEVPAAVETALTGAGFKVLRGTSPDGGVRLTVRSAQSQTLGHVDVSATGELRPNIFKQASAVNAALPKVEISPA